MQREIIFKAKRIDNGEWVEGQYVNTCYPEKHNETGHFIAVYPDKLYEIYTSTICPCTGLTDKNGNKIWENDIVEFLGHKGVVKYTCGSFGIAFNDCIDWEEIESNICPATGCDNALYACENDNFISLWEIYWNFNDVDNVLNMVEVVGNIFDNPELLEVEQHEAD